jgi:hypothetical protein
MEPGKRVFGVDEFGRMHFESVFIDLHKERIFDRFVEQSRIAKIAVLLNESANTAPSF